MATLKLHKSEVEMLPPKKNVIHIWNEHKVAGILWLTNQRIAFRADINNKDHIELNSWDVYYASICSIKKYTSPIDKSENFQYIRVSTMKFQTYNIALPSDSHDKMSLIHFIKKYRKLPYFKELGQSQNSPDTPEQISPWESIIFRDGNFKRSDINFGYRLSIYYPKFIFVPNSVTIQQAKSSAATRELGQLMLVVWAQVSGALLFRTLCNRASRMSAGDFIWVRAHALKCPKKTIKFFNIGTRNTFHLEYEDFKSEYLDLPNDSTIQLAFNEIQDSIRYGKRFYHQTQVTWLEIHSKILEVASRIAVFLQSNESICIQATSKSFIQFPVISIIQILSDPYFRTINGICSLIEKDWINCHFPFQRHLESHSFPHFEIFVHNIWMIWSYYPLEFEFDKSFLHFLLDSLYSMRYSTFLFNEHKSRSQSKIILPTIFEQIKKKHSKFCSPAYKPQRGLLQVEGLTKRPTIWTSRILKYSLYSGADGNRACEECTFSNGERSYELKPPYKWANIPEKLIKLDNLVALYLESANFTCLPVELIAARSLKRLSFSDNPIRHIPEDWTIIIGINLTNLQCLNLDMICAQIYPENIQNNIPSLVHFKFNKMDLGDQEELVVPFSITSPDTNNNMEILELSHNKLAIFPPALAYITKLTTLIISNNNLTQLPPQLNSLCNLKKIDLSSNAITSLDLPASGKYRLASLKYLFLNNNQISSLPPDMGYFPSLASVDLSRNKLESIPNKIFLAFSSIRTLNLSHNRISQLDNSIGHLKRLKHLEFRHNFLKSTPTAIVGLKKLRYLDLSYNRLKILNGFIGIMSSLRYLNISFNLLTELPIQLGMLKKTLKELKIDGNDLTVPSQRSLAQDSKSILNYLYDSAYSKKPKYQIKAMVFGEENVGKTTIVNQMIRYWNDRNIDSIFDVAPPLSTDGIVISGSSFVWKNVEENKVSGLPSEVEIKVNWWDFAGQELYYTTHQLFLSSRTLFIVVWNLKKDIQSSKVIFWLNSIRSKVSSATVILVGTHLDRLKESKKQDFESYVYSNKVRLRLLFQSLSIAVVCVSTRTGEGMKEFKDLLENKIVNSSYLKEVFPTSYLLLEQSIIDARKEKAIPIMMKHEFKMLATMCAVPEQNLSRALKLLHSLGSLYLDRDSEIPYYIVIDPQWLATMLATLITTKHSFVHAGIISHWSLKHIWKDLPLEHYEYLLGLFEKFELCYSLSEYVDLDDVKTKIMKRGRLSRGKRPHKLRLGSSNPQRMISLGSTDAEVSPELVSAVHLPKKSNNAVDSKQVKLLESKPSESNDLVTQTENSHNGSVNMRMAFKILEKDRFEKFNWDGFSLVPSVLPSEFPTYIESDSEFALKESEHEANRLYLFEFIPDGLFSRLMVRLLQSFLDQSLEFICWKTGIILLRQNDKIFVTVKSECECEVLEAIVRSKNFPHHGKVFCTLLEVCGTLFNEWQCLNIQHKIMCTRCRKAGIVPPFCFSLDEVLKAMRRDESCIYCKSQNQNQHCVRIEELVPEAELIYIEGRKIAYEDISFGPAIGQGGFATVYKGLYKDQEVAIKCLKTQFSMQEGEHTHEYEGMSKEFNEFRKEAFMMLDIDNLYCIKLVGVCLKPLSMVTELIKHRDLYTLCNSRDIPFEWPLRLKIALDVARGLDYLHSQKPSIIHNDFKSPNILLVSLDSKQLVCAKISDFGLSVRGTKMYTRMVDNPIWLAPEILKGQTYGCKADIYAYGVILWEMLERKKYFEELAFNSEVEFHVIDGIRPEITQECVPEYETLIRTCWDGDPRKRPTSTQIVTLVEQINRKYENGQYDI